MSFGEAQLCKIQLSCHTCLVGLPVGVLSSESAKEKLYRLTPNVVPKTVATQTQAVLPLAWRDAHKLQDATFSDRVERVYP